MSVRVIEFSPPMEGIEGEFNTFRLGGAWAKRVVPGDTVWLMDKKQFLIFGSATVTEIHVGKLNEMSDLYACHNHNQKGLDPEGANKRLITNMIKRYGPNMCDENKRVTVICMRRTE